MGPVCLMHLEHRLTRALNLTSGYLSGSGAAFLVNWLAWAPEGVISFESAQTLCVFK